MKEAVIGIDIGGTFTKYGVIDREGNCMAESFTNTTTHYNFDDYLKDLYDAIEKNMQFLKGQVEIKGVGIGAPNGNYYAGTIENAVNLNWRGIIPVSEKMKKYYPGLTIALTNDANAAAIGEMVFGGAKDMKDFIVITLGTGLGSGIVVNGDLVYGQDGFAGELGHINAHLNGRDCGCGRKGCLEAYASASGIRRTVFWLLAERMIDSELREVNFNDLTAKMISEAALRGDKIALEAFDYTGWILGSKLADTVAHNSPEAIFLLGGLANSRELIINPTKKYMEENLLPIYRNKVKILLSSLPDMNAGVLGAGALAWNELRRL
ncbi:MAG TPA: ROK family protein [Bacteroidales bacterium]|nr:ROK family protein [Bacteroidales bacterium]